MAPADVMPLSFVKAHAYGNDFLLVEGAPVDGALRARRLCHRQTGLGADGLIFFEATAAGAVMTLFNADGSPAEVSGNGVRCLAAHLAHVRGVGPADGAPIVVDTDGGRKELTLLSTDPPRYTFRATMGRPTDLRPLDLEVDGETVSVVALSVGNPQCLVLTDVLDLARFEHLAPRLATHAAFPEGTNVEFVRVVSPRRIEVLIWERGVGPTQSSGTGACGSAVAAAAYGGAERVVEVVSPGGSQEVAWGEDELRLTGWAELVARGDSWL